MGSYDKLIRPSDWRKALRSSGDFEIPDWKKKAMTGHRGLRRHPEISGMGKGVHQETI